MSLPPTFPSTPNSFEDFAAFCIKANPILDQVRDECLMKAEREGKRGIYSHKEVQDLAKRIGQEGIEMLKEKLESAFDPLKEGYNIEDYVEGKKLQFLFRSQFGGDIRQVLEGKRGAQKVPSDDESGYSSP